MDLVMRVQGHGGVIIKVVHLNNNNNNKNFSSWPVVLIPLFALSSERPQRAAQLVVRAPL